MEWSEAAFRREEAAGVWEWWGGRISPLSAQTLKAAIPRDPQGLGAEHWITILQVLQSLTRSGEVYVLNSHPFSHILYIVSSLLVKPYAMLALWLYIAQGIMARKKLHMIPAGTLL